MYGYLNRIDIQKMYILMISNDKKKWFQNFRYFLLTKVKILFKFNLNGNNNNFRVKQNLGHFLCFSYFCSIFAQNMQIVLFSILMIKTFFWRNIQNKFEFETFSVCRDMVE